MPLVPGSARRPSRSSGSTVREMEESAEQLGPFLAAHRPQEERPAAQPDLISTALADAPRRKRATTEMFLQRSAPQPRDAHGRWQGFDGGARSGVPARHDPVLEHDEAVARLASWASTFRGVTF